MGEICSLNFRVFSVFRGEILTGLLAKAYVNKLMETYSQLILDSDS